MKGREGPPFSTVWDADPAAARFARYADLGGACPPVCRLALATRGNTSLDAADVVRAVERGVNFLNWCGYDDGVTRAVRERLIVRDRVVLATQLESRDGRGAGRELEESLRLLGTERIEVVTFYYVESESEWQRIAGEGGALKALEAARQQGKISLIGLTTHQRPLAARWAESGRLDLLMIRYNAAHRGAEQDVFPETARLKMPVVAYTAQRWGALAEPTPHDPPDFTPPPAREWYRFALAHPAVSAVLMAPDGREELEEDLKLLDDWRTPTPEELALLTAHGERVRQHAGVFW